VPFYNNYINRSDKKHQLIKNKAKVPPFAALVDLGNTRE
jgi:hypothetical protein